MLAINILGRFLLNTDKNIRYVALNTLLKVVHIDLNSIQRHRPTIIECLKDPDVSLKRRAMELCFALINRANVVEMIDQLMDFLATCEPEFKADCSSNMFISMEKYAANQNWHVDQMMRVLKTAGNYIRDDIVSSFITLISNMNDFQFYTMNHLVKLIQDDITQQPLVQVAVWCLGEYGDRYSTTNENDESHMSIDDIVNLLIRVLNYNAGLVATREYAINALVKLSTRYPHITNHVQTIMSIYGCNMNLELQQRAVEYNAVLKRYENLREGLFEQMPPIEIKTQNDLSTFQDEEEEQQEQQAEENEQAQSGDANKRKEEATKTLLAFFDDDVPTTSVETSQTTNAKMDSVNIFDLLDDPKPTPVSNTAKPAMSKAANNNLDSLFSLETNIPTQQTSSVSANPLNDLFGLGQTVQAKSQPIASNSNNVDILDIFGSSGGPSVSSAHSSSSHAKPASDNLEDLLGFGGSTSTQPTTTNSNTAAINNDLFDILGSSSTTTKQNSTFSTTSNQTPSASRTLIIYDKNELKLTLEPSSKSRNSLEQINLEMKANNSNLMHSVNEFLFSAAVPKTMQMQLSPPTSNQILPLDFVTQSILVWNPKQVINIYRKKTSVILFAFIWFCV